MTTGRKISEFNQLNDIADQDILLAVDVSDTTSSSIGTTKKVLFSELKGDITSGLNIANWDTAYSWGNHATAGYQTDFTETDPVFSAHVASGITSTKIGQWDAAYGWGNHAVQGYLQSISALSINALNDVAINSGTLAVNQVIKWNGTSWVNGTGGAGTTINGLNDVGDVTITSSSLADDQILRYDSGTQRWRNETDASITLTDLSVASTGSPSVDNTRIEYNSTNGQFTYYPPDLSGYVSSLGSINGHTDVNTTSSAPSDGQALVYNAGLSNWVPGNIVSGTGTSLPDGTTDGDSVVWAGGAWRIGPNLGGYSYGTIADPYWDNVTFLLNAEQRTSQSDNDHGEILDRSKYGLQLENSAVITKDRAKFGDSSIRADGGSNDHIYSDWEYSSAQSQVTNFDFVDQDFTVESWISFNDADDNDGMVLFHLDDEGTKVFCIKLDGVDNEIVVEYDGGTITANTGFTFINDVWFHIAVTRKNNTLYIFKDGLKVKEVAFTNYIDEPTRMYIGRYPAGGGYLTGFLDSFRVTKGVARYSDTFAPPTAEHPVGFDEHWDNVELLVDQQRTSSSSGGGWSPFDRSDNAYNIFDQAGNYDGGDNYIGQLVGNYQFTIGGNNYLYVTNVDSNLDLGTSNWTFDTRLALTANRAHHTIFSTNSKSAWNPTNTTLSDPVNFEVWIDNDGTQTFNVSADNGSTVVSDTIAAANNFNFIGAHVAITRNGTEIALWKNGVKIANVNIGSTTSIQSANNIMYGNTLEYSNRVNGAYSLYAHASWFRLTKNVVRYVTGNTYDPVWRPMENGSSTTTTAPERYVPLSTLKTAASGAADFAAFKTAIAAL